MLDKQVYLGSFAKEEEAAYVYDQAALYLSQMEL
jgi:hypothetical protein